MALKPIDYYFNANMRDFNLYDVDLIDKAITHFNMLLGNSQATHSLPVDFNPRVGKIIDLAKKLKINPTLSVLEPGDFKE